MSKARGYVVTANVQPMAGIIAGPNEQRVALVFTGPPGNPMADFVTISTEPNVSDKRGLVLTAGMTLELTYERHGDSVKKPWYAVSTTVTQIGYLEVSLDG